MSIDDEWTKTDSAILSGVMLPALVCSVYVMVALDFISGVILLVMTIAAGVLVVLSEVGKSIQIKK